MARHRRRYRITTDSNHSYMEAPNMLSRGFSVGLRNTTWLSDIIYNSDKRRMALSCSHQGPLLQEGRGVVHGQDHD